MERLLINQDDQKFNAIVRDFNGIKPMLDILKAAYESLNIGSFDSEVFFDIKENGASNIKERFELELNKQLDASGVKFPALRKELFEGSLPLLNNFIKACNEVPSSINKNPHATYELSYVGYDDKQGGFTPCTDESKELILENYCRLYTETEQEYKLYTAAQKFLDAYREMEDAVKETATKALFIQNNFGAEGLLMLNRILVKEADKDVKVSHDVVGYIREQQRRDAHAIKQSEKEAAKRKAKEEEESKKVYFDISTPEGDSAFQAYSDQRQHEKRLQMQKQGYRF